MHDDLPLFFGPESQLGPNQGLAGSIATRQYRDRTIHGDGLDGLQDVVALIFKFSVHGCLYKNWIPLVSQMGHCKLPSSMPISLIGPTWPQPKHLYFCSFLVLGFLAR